MVVGQSEHVDARLRGRLVHVNVASCTVFAAVSGSSPATVVAIGSILMPAMVKQGYPIKFGVGVIASSGGQTVPR